MAQTQKVGKAHTNVIDNEDRIVVKYHATNVVEYDKRKSLVTLNHGGWKSATTKARMNQASNQFGLGFNVFQKSWDWFVTCPNGETYPFNNREICFLSFQS